MGGHASRRKRALALCSVALVVAGGVTALVWQLSREPEPLAQAERASVENITEAAGAGFEAAAGNAGRGVPGLAAGTDNPAGDPVIAKVNGKELHRSDVIESANRYAASDSTTTTISTAIRA